MYLHVIICTDSLPFYLTSGFCFCFLVFFLQWSLNLLGQVVTKNNGRRGTLKDFENTVVLISFVSVLLGVMVI